MNDCKYALEIMNQELSNKFISPEITYAFVTCIEALEKQITNGWIPVSERLPNTGETVLLTVPVNRGISHGYGSVDIAWICDKDNKCFYGTDGKYSFEQVIAWQPLPESYTDTTN